MVLGKRFMADVGHYTLGSVHYDHPSTICYYVKATENSRVTI